MIAEHFESDALLCHRDDCLLVHVRVVDAHAAEYRERLNEVLVVFGEHLTEANQQVIRTAARTMSESKPTKSSNLLIS